MENQNRLKDPISSTLRMGFGAHRALQGIGNSDEHRDPISTTLRVGSGTHRALQGMGIRNLPSQESPTCLGSMEWLLWPRCPCSVRGDSLLAGWRSWKLLAALGGSPGAGAGWAHAKALL